MIADEIRLITTPVVKELAESREFNPLRRKILRMWLLRPPLLFASADSCRPSKSTAASTAFLVKNVGQCCLVLEGGLFAWSAATP
jgi:hypothetical protein